MKVKVVYSTWGADGFEEPLHGGVQELDDVTAEQARSLAGAAASGVIEIVEASDDEQELLDGHVQSQEDGEAAYAAAHESGLWQHGNLLDFIATKKNRLVHDDMVAAGQLEGDVLSEDARAGLEAQIVQAQEKLATVAVPE